MKPAVLILQANGTNRDYDAEQAFRLAGGEPHCIPLNYLRTEKVSWKDYQILVLPGGFSYGDALGAGKLLALDLGTYFTEEIYAFVQALKPVIGICNGFQALVKSGILLDSNKIRATLTFNTSGKFQCRWVTLKPVSQKCIWTRGLSELLVCPVAHGEGNFQVQGPNDVYQLFSDDQVGFLYCRKDGSPANREYPTNPNGSVDDIAGVCNITGNVLGLMPHPENHIYPYQHPRFRRGETEGSGLALFRAGVHYAEQM